MCKDCWRRSGKPQIDNALVRLAVKLADEVYGYNLVGGRLHIMLDDWNVNSSDIRWLERYLKDRPPDSDEQHKAETICLRVFKALRYKERLSALALQEGLWGDHVGIMTDLGVLGDIDDQRAIHCR